VTETTGPGTETIPATTASTERIDSGGGAIVFDSERDGDADVYAMALDGSSRVRLTNDRGVDAGAKWFPDGSKIAFWSDRDGDADIYVMNADGTGVQKLTDNETNDYNPAWSSDGTRIAFERQGGDQYDVWTMSAFGGDEVRLTTGATFDGAPAYSPDGQTIAFTSDRDGDNEIFVMDVDGSDQRQLTDDEGGDDYAAYSPDGSTIAYASAPKDGTWDIWLMDADGANQRQVTAGPRDDVIPSFADGGSRIVYESNEDGGDYEIWSMQADGSGATPLTDDLTQDFQPDASSSAAVPAPTGDTPFLTDPSAFPTKREAELLTHVDPATRETCEREGRSSIAGKAIAGVACSSGNFKVFYDSFRTKEAMTDYYDRFAQYSDGSPFPRDEGDCGTSDVAEGAWKRDGEVAGRRTCYDTSDGFRVVVWTDDALAVVGFADVKPADREGLFGFWRSKRAQLVS
jgi:Tol biopolymer transport system component